MGGKSSNEVLELVAEADESDEEDEDLIMDRLIEEQLAEQFQHIVGVDSFAMRKNSMMDSLLR